MRKILTLAATSLCLSIIAIDHADARSLPSTTDRPSRRSIRSSVELFPRETKRYPTVLSVTLSQTHDLPEYGMQFQYPDGWELNDLREEEDGLTLVMMMLSPEKEAISGIRMNVNLVVEKLGSLVSLDEYTKLGISKEQEFFDTFDIVSQHRVLFGRETAHQIEFVASAEGGVPLAYRQVWFVKDGSAYVWTFADHPRGFDNHIGIFERITDSIRQR